MIEMLCVVDLFYLIFSRVSSDNLDVYFPRSNVFPSRRREPIEECRIISRVGEVINQCVLSDLVHIGIACVHLLWLCGFKSHVGVVEL